MREREWLENWCKERVRSSPYADMDEARRLAGEAERAAAEEDVSIKKALEQIDYSDLETYLLRKLEAYR